MPEPLFDSYIRADATARCERCGEPDPTGTLRRCAQCSYWLCQTCHAFHVLDRMTRRIARQQTLCDVVVEAAWMHAVMRVGDEEQEQFDQELTDPMLVRLCTLTDEDWDFARRACLSSLWTGARA